MKMNFTRKGLFGAVGPFLPVIIGIGLKFSLYDKPTPSLATFFKEHYVTGLWIDFIATAYISGVAWLIARKQTDPLDTALAFYVLVMPAGVLLVCLLFAFGAPKVGGGELFTLWLPAGLAAISVALTGNLLANS
jgi:hypothetical protein